MRLHYFADYEGYEGGRPILWGQVTHSIEAVEAVSMIRRTSAAMECPLAFALKLTG